MRQSQFAALLGFLFVAAWAALSFGDAILCLLGAAVFYLLAAIRAGEIDLNDLQRHAQGPRR